jgi:hypothetical protein
MALFSDLFGSGYQDAANAQKAGLTAGYGQASDQYGQGRSAINTSYSAALSPFTDVFGSATSGANAYGDATGANGAAGNARGLANFQASPGYQWQLGQGLQAIDRGAASRGMLTSGNTLTAEQQYGQGLANQNYQQYVQNLQPYLNQQTQGAAGIAGVNMGQGNALNTSYGNQGNLAYNTQAGIGNAQAAADTAGQNASNSFLGGVLNLGTKLLGYNNSGGGGGQ